MLNGAVAGSRADQPAWKWRAIEGVSKIGGGGAEQSSRNGIENGFEMDKHHKDEPKTSEVSPSVQQNRTNLFVWSSSRRLERGGGVWPGHPGLGEATCTTRFCF